MKLEAVVTALPLPMVMPEKVSAFEFAMDEPPAMVMVPEEALNVVAALTVSAPATAKVLEVVTVPELAVRFQNVSVPPELTMEEPAFIVTVPPVGVKVPVTVNMLPTVAVFVAPVMEPLTRNAP